MTKILLIESDIKTVLSLKFMLLYKGMSVTACSDTQNALYQLKRKHFHIIIAGNRQKNIYEFIKNIRSLGYYLPVIFLGDQKSEQDVREKLSGLDEFLPKPFNYQELTAALTRATSKSLSSQRPLLYGEISMCEKRKVLWIKDKTIPLAKMETKILSLLSRKAGKIVPLDALYALYDLDSNLNTRIFSYVINIRKKLEDAGVNSLRIQFVQDGYKLEVV